MFKKILSALLCCAMAVSMAACEKDEAEKSGDYLSFNRWESTDGMLLSLDDDNEFKWYLDSSDRRDNYYSGTYTVMVGLDAMEYMAENHDLTVEGQQSAIAEFAVTTDEYYVVTLNNEEQIVGGENILSEQFSADYYGYYLDTYESLNLFSVKTMTEYQFKKK